MTNPIQDTQLTFKARGLYAYLKKYGNKKTSARELATLSRDGRDSILTGLKELEAAGYLRREKHVDGKLTYHLL